VRSKNKPKNFCTAEYAEEGKQKGTFFCERQKSGPRLKLVHHRQGTSLDYLGRLRSDLAGMLSA